MEITVGDLIEKLSEFGNDKAIISIQCCDGEFEDFAKIEPYPIAVRDKDDKLIELEVAEATHCLLLFEE